MNILFLHKYGRKSASFRCRLEQYLPYFHAAGYCYKIESLLDDAYLTKRFLTNQRSLLSYVKPLLYRLSLLWRVRQFDLVIIYIDFLPYCPALFERYLKWLKIPYIFDYDDAVFHYYDLNTNYLVKLFLANKFNTVLSCATHVIGGSEYLVNYAQQFNKKVSYLPTVLQAQRYNKVKKFTHKPQPFIIGWIGSPSTTVYLELIVPALDYISQYYDVQLVLIGAKFIKFPDTISAFIKPWSEQQEIAELLCFDVGIMPLANDKWSQGKCGFKLIQYMACGLPVIASAVGENNKIVRHGVNGFLASNIFEWQQALECLINDMALCQAMGRQGRGLFEKYYNLSVTAPKLMAIINQAIKS